MLPHIRQSSTQNNKYQVSQNTVISPDDGHVVARNMYRKEINILRKIVHQVGFVYRIILNRQTFCNVDLTELVLDLIWSRDDSSVETFFIGGS